MSDWRSITRKRRRDAWINANGPCQSCGGNDQLQLDHIDPATKVSHEPWLWARERRERELAKCQVLCLKCHAAKTRPSQIAAALKRVGVPVERLVPAEVFTLVCAGCQKTFTRRASRERFIRKHRENGPFCGPVCRGTAVATRGWAKRRTFPEALAKERRILELGRAGIPITKIVAEVGGRHEVVRRALLAANIKIRHRGSKVLS